MDQTLWRKLDVRKKPMNLLRKPSLTQVIKAELQEERKALLAYEAAREYNSKMAELKASNIARLVAHMDSGKFN